MVADMTASISVLIPIYRESRFLEENLKKLLEYRYEGEKEIIVVIDEPTPESLKVIKRLRGKAKFIINWVRKGKSTVLNEAIAMSKGDILLFLDGDVELPPDYDFLEKLVKEMQETDILDLRKEVLIDSSLARLTYYEYLSFNVCSWLASKLLGSYPSINGAAFAVWRKVILELGGFRRVISEDLDLATRAFLRGFRMKYSKSLTVLNAVHSRWNSWLKQRKRWAVGLAYWLKDYHRELIGSVVKHPKIFLPILILLFPSIVAIFAGVVLPDILVGRMLPLALLMLIARVELSLSLPILVIPLYINAYLIQNTLGPLLSFFAFSVLFWVFAKKLDFAFKLHEFFVYYFFYSPVYLAMIIVNMVQVLLLHREVEVDWKV